MSGMKTYRIINWDQLYENNRSRELKQTAWVPFVNRCDTPGYTYLMARKDGPLIWAAWTSMVLMASRCNPRGTLLNDNGRPIDAATLARMIRMSEKVVSKMFEVTCSPEMQWLEAIEDNPTAGSSDASGASPQEGAGKSQPGAQKEGKGKEQNGMEGNGSEQQGNAAAEDSSDAAHLISYFNLKASRTFRLTPDRKKAIEARLDEVNRDVKGVEATIDRLCAQWKNDPKMAEHLTIETAFRKTNFHRYYDVRDVPIMVKARDVVADHSKGFFGDE